MKTPSIIAKPVGALDSALLYAEEKSSLFGVSLLLGAALMACAILYVGFPRLPEFHGIFYAQLASDPFQPGNPNAYRILTPLVAFLTGFRGERIIILNALVALSLLALVYYHSRRHEYSPSLSLAVATMLALTMPTLFTLFYGGYTDSTSYLLIFLMLVFRARPVWFWLLFLLGLLNRESVIFLLPFFALLHWHGLKSKRVFIRSMLYGLIVVLVIYLLFRVLISSQSVVKHSAAFYLKPLMEDPLYWLRQAARAYPAGFFSAFKLFWLLPPVALFFSLRRRDYFMAVLLTAPIICAVAQSLIAVDTSRMIAMSFPALLISVAVIRKKTNERILSAAILSLALLNLLVPQYYVTSNDVFLMQ